MATHRFILSGGHRNTDRGGALNERDWTDDWTRFQRESIEARGGKASIVHEHDGDAQPTDSTQMGLQRVAARAASLAKEQGGVDAYLSGHYNGTGSEGGSGFHAIFPDARSGADMGIYNPTDKDLCRLMVEEVRQTGTVGILGWTAAGPGVMSERETRVGSTLYGGQYGRLGEFVGTLPMRDSAARVILEAANVSSKREQAYLRDARWVRHTYCEAMTDALERKFGKFNADAPAPPKPVPNPTPGYARPSMVPDLDQFVNRPDAFIPATMEINGQWWWFISKDVQTTQATPRNLFAEDNAPKVGTDLAPGETFYAFWGTVAANGRPVAYTIWGTRVWLDHTNYGAVDA